MGFTLCRSLLGREQEMAQLAAAMKRASQRDGQLTFLVGEAGVGKSRLAREATDKAAEAGFATLAGRASESAVQLPYRPLSEALIRAARDGLSPDGRGVEPYRPALASLVPEWGRAADGGAEVSGIIVAEALVRLLSELGKPGALLILEDLQWADPETQTVVEYLAGNLAGSPVLCLATVRDFEQSAGLDLARGLAGRGAAGLIELPRLPDAAVRAMAAECLGAEQTGTGEVPDAVAELLGRSDGLPFAVEELLAAATTSGLLGGQDPDGSAAGGRAGDVPASIGSSVTRRIAACGPDVAEVLAWAAVLGSLFDPQLLPALSGLADSAVLAALEQAQQARFIEPADGRAGLLRFRLSLTRSAVVAGLLPPERAARSAQAAGAVEAAHPELPGGWCQLAAELHEAAGAHARAAALLLEAGRRALRQGALHTATASLEAARDLAARTPDADPDMMSSLDLLLFETFAATGDRPRLALAASRLIASLDDDRTQPRLRARIMIMTATARHEHDFAAATDQLAAGRRMAELQHDTALVSEANIALAQCAVDSAGMDRARGLARQALAAAQSAGLTGWAARVGVQALQLIGTTEKPHDLNAARTAFERAYQVADDSDNVVGRIDALSQLGTIEMLEEGTGENLVKGSEEAHKAGAISAAALIDIKFAILAAARGDLGRAYATARQCEQEAVRIRAYRARALAIAAQGFAGAIAGDRETAESEARRAESILPGSQEIQFTTRGLVRVTAALFSDDLSGALQHAIAAAEFAQQVPPRAPSMAWALYPFVHAVSGYDESAALDRARATAAAVKWNRGFFGCAEAVVAGRAGRRREAALLADEGLALLAPFAPQWSHLARQLIAGPALTDHWGEPVRWLRDSAQAFEASGHHALVAACHRTLRRAGQPVPRPRRDNSAIPDPLRELGITCRELDVYRLLARGMANCQIARQLDISPKTVDTHVASLVVKTGRTGRRELVAHAARHIPVSQPAREAEVSQAGLEYRRTG
jgi:DNA-binding CsgD family transcriptional regulator